MTIQIYINYLNDKKQKERENLIGNVISKILDMNFLYNYEPGKVSSDKIIQDFGQPNRLQRYNSDNDKIIVEYFYIFKNAKVLFTTYDNDTEIISITLFSTRDIKNPILCRLSYEEDDNFFGESKLTSTILKDSFEIKNQESIHEQITIIKSRYFYKQIKHLTFNYVIDGQFEKLVNAKGQLIQQICISQVEDVCPTINFF